MVNQPVHLGVGQASIFVSPRKRVAQLYYQALLSLGWKLALLYIFSAVLIENVFPITACPQSWLIVAAVLPSPVRTAVT
jgi:hypothetical protein